MEVSILLFDNFETLDVFGPVEILGRLADKYRLRFFSMEGGIISNSHGVHIQTEKLAAISGGTGIFLIPGGYGTRIEINNTALIKAITTIAEKTDFVLTVCTGTALLAKTGLLNGRRATSNKRAFDWVAGTGERVQWIKRARWVVDGKYYTSSGVSAGMDMTLGLLSDRHGIDFARQTAFTIEYRWQENKDEDDFCYQ
jgi:putative intracellular protease/amidase